MQLSIGDLITASIFLELFLFILQTQVRPGMWDFLYVRGAAIMLLHD